MRLVSIITFLFLVFSAPAMAAVDSTHVGFVDSSVWFDREPFFSGEEVRVYTTLANSSTADFDGVVEFYDGDASIGSSNVVLERNGGFQVVWADWVPKEGDHSVSVKITKATLTPPSGEPEEVSYENVAKALDRFIDTDTDGDGIGNSEDSDDDNDGILDSEDDEPLVVRIVEIPNEINEGSVKESLEEKSTEIVSNLGELASSTSPVIIASVEKAIDAVEEFRVIQSNNIDKKIKEVKQKINEGQTDIEGVSEGEEKKRNDPFNQLQLLALTTAGYTLSHKIVFYITGIFILYFIFRKVIPWMYRLVRGREE